jgi:hypothetical protein
MGSMATIRTNDHAPNEVAKYILPLETFDLGPGDSFETENRNTLSNAEVHPWLEVEYPVYEELGGAARESGSVPPSEDAFSAEGPRANEPFDPEAVARDRGLVEAIAPTAIDSGRDQGEPESEGRIAVTLAAADEASTDTESDDSKEA